MVFLPMASPVTCENWFATEGICGRITLVLFKRISLFLAFLWLSILYSVAANSDNDNAFGSTNGGESSLSGIFIDLTHSRKGEVLATTSLPGEKKRIELLLRTLGGLSYHWRIGRTEEEHPPSPKHLYATKIFFSKNDSPFGQSSAAKAFGSSLKGAGWLCFYNGYFSVPEEGDYRFVGMARDVMAVGMRVNNGINGWATVLYAFQPGKGYGRAVECGRDWEPIGFCGKDGNDGAEVAKGAKNDMDMLYKGSWLHLQPGISYAVRVAFGRASSSDKEVTCAYLGIQRKGVDTDDNFPVFTTERVTPILRAGANQGGLENGKYNVSSVFKAQQTNKTKNNDLRSNY